MLYLDYINNKEDFILEKENKYPSIIKKILYLYRKIVGNPIVYEIDGKEVVLISKINKKTFKKLDKIFEIDVTKRVCLCELLRENNVFLEYLKFRNIQIFDGKWLFQYLIKNISEYICNKKNLVPETQEISVLINNPSFLVFENLKKLSQEFKNINVVTKNIKKFDKIKEMIYEKNGLILNITNNYKKACVNSKIVYNFDFVEKDLNKIRFMLDCYIVNFNDSVKIYQSSFKGENVDFYSVNLPLKYRNIYKKLNNFNSSILYESLIFKNTSIQNIWNEIENDKIEVIGLENSRKIMC